MHQHKSATCLKPHLRVVVARQVQQLVVHQFDIVGRGSSLGPAANRWATRLVNSNTPFCLDRQIWEAASAQPRLLRQRRQPATAARPPSLNMWIALRAPHANQHSSPN